MSRSVAEQSAILSSHHAEALIRARRFGVPRSMIETAEARRRVGDWRGACRAAQVDVRLNLDALRHRYGSSLVGDLVTDLRSLAPDLLRWNLPRNLHGPGRLRSDLVVPLATYSREPGTDTLMLAAFTAKQALAAGERVLLVSLPLTLGGRAAVEPGPTAGEIGRLRLRQAGRYRLDQHSFSWDARTWPDLPVSDHRTDADPITRLQDQGRVEEAWAAAGIPLSVDSNQSLGAARGRQHTERWAHRVAAAPVNLTGLVAEARRLHPEADRVAFFPGSGWAIVLDGVSGSSVTARCVDAATAGGLPVLPLAAWSRPIDRDLVRLGFLAADQVHPLVSRAQLPPGTPAQTRSDSVLVRCGTTMHRLTLFENTWQAVDHHPDQLRRERSFARLGGPLCDCLREIELIMQDSGLAGDVDLYLQHGQIEPARTLVRSRLGAAAALSDIELPGGASATEVIADLKETALRYRLLLAGVQPWTSSVGFLPATSSHTRTSSTRRRRTRKGAGPANQVIT
ncbi:MAG TPA: hypothetical protein VLL08_15750 [Kineosporiaceae bacterium]|nr:hypothetical protein [Kineosporiaceae bacterium]